MTINRHLLTDQELAREVTAMVERLHERAKSVEQELQAARRALTASDQDCERVEAALEQALETLRKSENARTDVRYENVKVREAANDDDAVATITELRGALAEQDHTSTAAGQETLESAVADSAKSAARPVATATTTPTKARQMAYHERDGMLEKLRAALLENETHVHIRDACFEALGPECQCWGDVPGWIEELKKAQSSRPAENAKVLAEHSGNIESLEWRTAGAWLYPGQKIVVLDGKPEGGA